MKFNLLSTNCATLQVNCSEQTERPRPVDSKLISLLICGLASHKGTFNASSYYLPSMGCHLHLKCVREVSILAALFRPFSLWKMHRKGDFYQNMQPE